MIQSYSTCYELLYFEDKKGNVFAIWAFPKEYVLRAYYNGHHLHNDSRYCEPLPQYGEV